ncbi:Carcinine [Hypsibius exemplaris]|uniref:Carcinine n=1 Tax=Hypsibius exemplaris TaxID=2072580 RepID=A0A1W0XD39_HYPEX|nr:Carcinine [Hypsibius exemplaris]
MEFDDILLDVGDFGKYQILILCCLCLPLCFFSGIQCFLQLFLAAPPKDYWCRIPELSAFNSTIQLDLSIPFDNRTDSFGDRVQTHDHCQAFNRNYTIFTTANLSEWSHADFEVYNSTELTSCQNGWNYDTDGIQSIIPAWDLVCNHEFYPNLALFIFTLGSVCGLMIFGALSDLFGRKVAMFACISVQVTSGIISAFSPTFPIWCVMRFLCGLSVPSSFRIPMIYAIELVRPEKRTRVGILISASYSFGTIALAGFAVALTNWRQLTLCMTVPEVLLILLWWLTPESPRWLLAKNRSEQMKDFLRFTATINGRVLGSNTLNKLDLILDHESKTEPASSTIADLFRSPNMRKKTILISFIWFSNISSYMGLSYYSPTLHAQMYLSYLLSMAVEIPAYPAVWFLTERFGRRFPLCLFMICGGILCVVTVVLPEDAKSGILAMYVLGKFFISGSFFVICLYAGELYPTVVRGIGLGTSATIATVGVCLGPAIMHLGKNYMTLPLAIFGVFAILGAFAVLFLPETWHQKLPETLLEGEEFGKGGGLFQEFRLRSDMAKAGIGMQQQSISARMTAGELKGRDNREVLGELNVENPEEELVFDQVAHFRTFPQPQSKRPLSRLNSARGLMTAQDPQF